MSKLVAGIEQSIRANYYAKLGHRSSKTDIRPTPIGHGRVCISDDDLPAARIHMGLYRKLSATLPTRTKLIKGLNYFMDLWLSKLECCATQPRLYLLLKL